MILNYCKSVPSVDNSLTSGWMIFPCHVFALPVRLAGQAIRLCGPGGVQLTRRVAVVIYKAFISLVFMVGGSCL